MPISKYQSHYFATCGVPDLLAYMHDILVIPFFSKRLCILLGTITILSNHQLLLKIAKIHKPGSAFFFDVQGNWTYVPVDLDAYLL